MGEVVAGIEMPDGDPGAVEAAMQSLSRAGGGFQMAGEAVDRAGAAVGGWEGFASIQFHVASGAIRGNARDADEATDRARAALSVYRLDLVDVRKQIGDLQDLARDLEREARTARSQAGAAAERLGGITEQLPGATLAAVGDGGAQLRRLEGDATEAAGEMSRQSGIAERAEAELERLRGRAEKLHRELETSGDNAARAVRGAHSDLPPVLGGRSGTVGGIPLSSETGRNSVALTVVVVRVGGNQAIIKEELANGKWRVTIVNGVEGGLEFDPMPGASVDGEGRGRVESARGAADALAARAGRLGASPDVQAAFLAQHENGQVFEFASEHEANAFIEYRDEDVTDGQELLQYSPVGGIVSLLAGGQGREEREKTEWADRQKPVETFGQGGMFAGASADTGIGGARAEVFRGLGTKTDTASGATTHYVKITGSAAAQFAPGAFEAGGDVRGEAIAGVTRTKDGEVTGMTVTVSGEARGNSGFAPGGEARGVAGGVSGHESTGVRVERTINLDAIDPGNRAAIERFADTRGMDPDANVDIVRRGLDSARVDVRHFDVGGSSVGGELDTKVVKITAGHEEVNAELDSAKHKTPGGDEYVITHDR